MAVSGVTQLLRCLRDPSHPHPLPPTISQSFSLGPMSVSAAGPSVAASSSSNHTSSTGLVAQGDWTKNLVQLAKTAELKYVVNECPPPWACLCCKNGILVRGHFVCVSRGQYRDRWVYSGYNAPRMGLLHPEALSVAFPRLCWHAKTMQIAVERLDQLYAGRYGCATSVDGKDRHRRSSLGDACDDLTTPSLICGIARTSLSSVGPFQTLRRLLPQIPSRSIFISPVFAHTPALAEAGC